MNNILRPLAQGAFLVLVILAGNYIGYGVSPLLAIPGILILSACALLGMFLSGRFKIKALPAIVFISLAAVFFSAPWWPWTAGLSALVEQVDMLAIATPVLACAGVGIGAEFTQFRKQGLRMLIISLCVFTGTFICSACIAELIIRLTSH